MSQPVACELAGGMPAMFQVYIKACSDAAASCAWMRDTAQGNRLGVQQAMSMLTLALVGSWTFHGHSHQHSILIEPSALRTSSGSAAEAQADKHHWKCLMELCLTLATGGSNQTHLDWPLL